MKRTVILLIMAVSLTSCIRLLDISGNENSEYLTFNEALYIGSGFYAAYEDMKLIGYIDNGAAVYAVRDDEPPRFIRIEGSDNSGNFVAEGAQIPNEGRITKVLIDPESRISNVLLLSEENELDMLSRITGLTGEAQEFFIDNYYTEGNAFYYIYNDSKVTCADNYGGYIVYTDGKWVYSAPSQRIERLEHNSAVITGIVIEDKELINEMCGTDLVKYIEYES